LPEEFDYRSYVTDDVFLDAYNEYQAKYAAQMRESDKVMLALMRDRLMTMGASGSATVLDIGCSTGNFLLHLRRAMPELQLVGGDLAESSLDVCRRNPALAGVSFERLDILDLPTGGRFDVVVVNAVLYMLSDEQFQQALDSLTGCLAPGGGLLIFDFFHAYPQQISIIERSHSHPDGLALNFRPFPLVSGWLEQRGFGDIEFHPFELTIDLPRTDDPGLLTYTVRAADGAALAFRGTLFQPWCHMVAVKRAG
jgi:SAM-dependent methyltransferase